jgi:hypothetical protein
MRPAVLGSLFLVTWLSGRPARAQEAAAPHPTLSPGVNLDADVVWIGRPPPLRLLTPGKDGVNIGGLPDDFVPRTSTLFAATAHASVYVATSDALFFPLLGFRMGGDHATPRDRAA